MAGCPSRTLTAPNSWSSQGRQVQEVQISKTHVSIDTWTDYVLDDLDGGNKSVRGVCGLEKHGESAPIVTPRLHPTSSPGIEPTIASNMSPASLKIGKMHCVWRPKTVCLPPPVVSRISPGG